VGGTSPHREKGEEMTRKDYEAVARVILCERASVEARECDTAKTLNAWETTARVAYQLAQVFEHQNPRFDRARFLEACGL
jgi:hypothetical protein